MEINIIDKQALNKTSIGVCPKERLIVFDFIRLFAIVMVVLSHNIRFGTFPISSLYLGVLGNGLFFFISGYLIYLNNNSINSKADIIHFYKKRLLRIYPLYIVAVIVHVIITTLISGSSYNSFEVIVSMLGLQMVFYPKFITYPFLWFIGMILIYYLIYPLIIYFSQKNWIKYLIYSCISIGLLIIFRLLTGLIGGGVFEYYFIFVAGVLSGMLNIFKSKYLLPLTLLSLILFIGCVCITQTFHPMISDTLTLSSTVVINTISIIALRIIYAISAIFTLYFVYNRLHIGQTMMKIITYGAFAAYAVYLFDRSYFTSMNALLSSFINISPLGYDILFLFLLLPILFILCYYIQKGENKVIAYIKSRFITFFNKGT